MCDSLFYIAGLCYQWLKSDILSSDLLRSGELLLLKVCAMVSNSLQYKILASQGVYICACYLHEDVCATSGFFTFRFCILSQYESSSII